MKKEGNKGNKWILRLVIVCLAVLFAQRADDLLSQDHMDALKVSESEIKNPETNLVKTENSSFSMPETRCRVPRQTNIAIPLRTFGQAHRHNISNHSRHGFTLTKSGKSMNEYTTSLFFRSLIDFPSGLAETNHHLISLGKLII